MCRHQEVKHFFLVTVLNLIQRAFSITYVTVINLTKRWKTEILVHGETFYFKKSLCPNGLKD